jgi:UDP-GlcNAc:undecaprenyl-phosphate GlcNAc-1-phosphate transferase
MPSIFLLTALAVTAAAVTWLATPLASLLGRRMGAWDHPDELGIHKTATPRTGGIAIAIGLFIGAQAAWSQSVDIIANRLVVAAATGSAMVFIVGLLDDLREIKPLAKALGLVAAAVAGQLIAPHASVTGFERLDFIIGVFILMLGANAVNLLDGMDGLASGLTAIMGLGFAAILYLDGRPLLTAQALILAGAAMGFWVSNRPPARIFMGDCGSLMLGYILAGMALRTSTYGSNQLVAAASILSLPILDTGLAMLRRLLAREDIFTGDRKHVYDLLYLRYRSVWRVDLAMYLVAAAFAGWGWPCSTCPGPPPSACWWRRGWVCSAGWCI